jgi:hypothetical protein
MIRVPKKSSKSNLSAEMRNELRRTAAIAGLLYVYKKGQMPQRAIFTCLDEAFHGSVEKGYVSQIDQIIGGLSPFDDLFERNTDVVTASANISISSSTSLVLKKELSRSEVSIIVGRDITKGILERTSFKEDSVLISGRTLYSIGKGCLRTIRKALACLSNLAEVEAIHSEGITYKSGVTESEVKERLLDEMFKLLKGKASLDDEPEDFGEEGTDDNKPAADNEVDNENNLEQRPSNWFFHGWIAFNLFGPFAPTKRRLSLLEIGKNENDNKKKSSRATSRIAEKSEKAVERDAVAGIERGVSFNNKISLANLEMKRAHG